MDKLLIVPFSIDQTLQVSSLYQTLQKILDMEVLIENYSIDINDAYDPDRNQYHSTALISNLLSRYSDKILKVLGVTSLDLFIPVLTFVFGEAQLDGSVAVVSSCRLKPEFYGIPADDNLLADRLEKEAIHELGHTLGLIHCQYYECVMHSSNCVEDIDLKLLSFCPECENILLQKKVQP